MAMSEYPISPIATKNPELIITRASINSEPVELDGTPMSANELRMSSSTGQNTHVSYEEQGRRSELNRARQNDPAVLVDIPNTPDAGELATSGAGTAT